ncbi:hypothetical protein IQ62_08810 [Streptomyces scabiei]|uniref:hypothetical protein n=1 Tax=Streptomyces scabiei TaxID=1930 RepID=UPI0004E67B90|nr:hypothetical protein [Streptomyces scabiei]KFG01274.1 hypothetical protein IQ62_08810 [Streptomyces scabiei]
MPSASHPHVPSQPGRDVNVIDLHRRRPPTPSAAAAVSANGGNAAYQPDPHHTDPLNDLAATLEALFQKHVRTLTDDSTREAFGIAMTAVELMLQGSLAQGRLSPDDHLHLHGMLQGMRTASTLL